MKHAPFLFIFFLFSNTISADQLPKTHDERIQEMAKEGYNLIDTIFDNAHASLVKKEELMDEQWLSKQKEIKAIQNLLSDSTIIFTFDENSENPIPKVLSTYVEHTINEKIPFIFEIDRISVKQVEDFYAFSHTMCKLNGNFHCGRFIRKVESDHFEKILKLKAQKIAREQLRKEVAQELRDALLFGGPR
jgi:hypothetical protein